MRGQQIELLELLKQAICIVIDPLGPKDRLSMVSFSGHATRRTPLGSCVTDSSKATAKLTVGYTFAGLGGNNIVEGLGVSPRCLTAAGTKFVVASVILISDGQIVQAKGRRSKPCSAYVQAGRFLVLVYVPTTCPGKSVTRLVKVTCAYGDAVIGQAAHAAAPAAVIQRRYELTNGMALRRL
jgi:hypothetical protein